MVKLFAYCYNTTPSTAHDNFAFELVYEKFQMSWILQNTQAYLPCETLILMEKSSNLDWIVFTKDLSRA